MTTAGAVGVLLLALALANGLAPALALAAGSAQHPTLSPLFTDHAVLQMADQGNSIQPAVITGFSANQADKSSQTAEQPCK